MSVRLPGTVSARASCQPAPSSTSTAWASAGSAAANCARKRSITAALTTGSTRVEVLAGGGTDGGEDVGPLIALLHEAGRTLALQPPAVAYPPFVTDACLVLA